MSIFLDMTTMTTTTTTTTGRNQAQSRKWELCIVKPAREQSCQQGRFPAYGWLIYFLSGGTLLGLNMSLFVALNPCLASTSWRHRIIVAYLQIPTKWPLSCGLNLCFPFFFVKCFNREHRAGGASSPLLPNATARAWQCQQHHKLRPTGFENNSS
jgi:hypothetical protein